MPKDKQLSAIAEQVRKWNLGLVTDIGAHAIKSGSVTERYRCTFANMKRGSHGGRLHNVRRYSLSLVEMMSLAEIVRVPTHPARPIYGQPVA